MKTAIFVAMLALATSACGKEKEVTVTPAPVATVTAPAENDNCVKKDKNGKCPPLPKSPKPTPKKPAEEKSK
jgi:hypothetical protein